MKRDEVVAVCASNILAGYIMRVPPIQTMPMDKLAETALDVADRLVTRAAQRAAEQQQAAMPEPYDLIER